jgi:alpha-methylacyl-CoA racemase
MRGLGLWEDDRAHNLLDGGAPFYRTYRTSDGEWMAVGALEPAFYAALLRGLDLNDADLPAQLERDGWPVIEAAFTAAFSARTRAEWEATFAGTDACVTPVLSLDEAPDHPHNVARGVFEASSGATLPASAFRVAAPGPLAPTPSPGGDTDQILEEAGYSAAAITALREDEAIA